MFRPEILKYPVSHNFFRVQRKMYYEFSVAQSCLLPLRRVWSLHDQRKGQNSGNKLFIKNDCPSIVTSWRVMVSFYIILFRQNLIHKYINIWICYAELIESALGSLMETTIQDLDLAILFLEIGSCTPHTRFFPV